MMDMIPLEQRAIFICGVARSGTTLLQSLLDGHPELLVDASESRFFYTFLPQARRIPAAQRAELAERTFFLPRGRIFDPAGDHYKAYFSHIPYEAVREAFYRRLARSPQRYADYLTAAVLAYGEVTDQITGQTRWWVEKTIYNERYARDIFAWWPHARCIHMVRDPRDIFATWRARDVRQQRKPTTLDAFAYTWSGSARLAEQNRRRYGDDRYLVVRYEDLVQCPEQEIGRLVEFLGIHEHPALFRPSKVAGAFAWAGNSSRNETFAGIDTGSVGRWRSALTSDEVSMVEAMVAGGMRQLGYIRETQTSLAVHLKTLPYRALNVARSVRDAVTPNR